MLLSVDPESIWSGSAEWFISADEDTIDEICVRINGALWRDGALQELLSESGLDCSEDEFRKLISFSAGKISPDQNVVGENMEKRTRYARASVSIWYADEMTCRKLLDDLSGLMEELNREFAFGVSGCVFQQPDQRLR